MKLAGIDTIASDQAVASHLKSWSTLPTDDLAPIWHDASHNCVVVQASGAVSAAINQTGVKGIPILPIKSRSGFFRRHADCFSVV